MDIVLALPGSAQVRNRGQARPTKAASEKDSIRPLPSLDPGHAGARNTGRRVPPAGTGAGARATDAARRSGPP